MLIDIVKSDQGTEYLNTDKIIRVLAMHESDEMWIFTETDKHYLKFSNAEELQSLILRLKSAME
jgi:hypothetical protein